MEENVLVGILVGLVLGSSSYVWNSESFTKPQKIGLLCCLIFPPLQWFGILVVLLFNNYTTNNSVEKVAERKIEEVRNTLDDSISALYDLRQKGILTEEEYNQKVSKINNEKAEQELKNAVEYKQLQSLLNSNILTKEEFENKVKLLNNKTKKEINFDFRIVDGFSEGLGLAINSDLDYGYVNLNNEIIIPFIFDHAENFIDNKARVRINEEFKFINRDGNYVK
jgi:hypothetical protein